MFYILPDLPYSGAYKSALAMDPDIGYHVALQEREKEKAKASKKADPLSPFGYDLPTLLQLKAIDLQKETIRAISAQWSSKMPPQITPEPRPETAAQRWREKLDRDSVNDALKNLGIPI